MMIDVLLAKSCACIGKKDVVSGKDPKLMVVDGRGISSSRFQSRAKFILSMQEL